MEKLLTSCLKSFIVLLVVISCRPQHSWYEKELTDSLKVLYADRLWRGGYSYYYQGSIADQFQLNESLELDSTNGDAWREKGIAYLKRGIADSFYLNYKKGVQYRPEKWAGFRGYIYLYFYRDYERAIADFNYNDEIVGEVTYSQGQSHDYMRGICYYGLKDYGEALNQLNRYIDTITEGEGPEWVDVYAILYKGLALAKLRRFDEALAAFDNAEKLYPKLSDLYYHRARISCARKDYEKALQLLEVAKKYHQEGYYHQRPYVEVLEQVHSQDIERLQEELEAKRYAEV